MKRLIGNVKIEVLLKLPFVIFPSENVILEGEDRDGFYHSFVALSAHYIGLNVTECKYL